MKRTTPAPGSHMSTSQQQAMMLRRSVAKMLSNSILTSRATISNKMGKSFGGKRDLYNALGYPLDITFEDYYAKYKRQDIAARIIDAFVVGAWEQKPVVREPDTPGDESPFEKKWEEIVKKLKLWFVFTRLDTLTRIGRFGVLLLGFDDVTIPEDMQKEVGTTGKKAKELLYVQPFGENNIEIVDWEKNTASPRYNLPTVYELTIESPSKTRSTRKIKVHHSRIVHNAEGLLDSNVFGLPALERGYNRLLNLELIVGGSAEMFWQGAFPGYAFVADPETDMTQSKEAIEDEIDMFVHDFKRYMKLQGLKVEKLSSEVANPEAHVQVQITMLSIAYGIPTRILSGSERGQLASTQDESHWNDKLNGRRIDHLEPNIIRPVIDRLLQYSVLPEVGEDGYEVFWPDLNAPTEKDKAEVGKLVSESIKNYSMGLDTELLIPFDAFLEEILNLDPEKVLRIVEARELANGVMLGRENDEANNVEITSAEEDDADNT